MFLLAFALLCGAALLGAGLIGYYLKGARSARVLLAAHAVLGMAGLAALFVVLWHGLPRTAMGTAGFGTTAAVLLGLALACGLPIARAEWQRQRPAELLVGTHAGLAIAGLVVLLALVALG